MKPKTTRIAIILFAVVLPLMAGAQSLTEGAALLFKNIKSTLTTAEKNKLFIDAGFRLSKDRQQFTAEGDDTGEYPFSAFVAPTDLNKDGAEEVFIVYGNTYTSGAAGSSVIVFIKNPAGKYVKHLDVPGMSPDVLATTGKGYPDLLIGGPGSEYPVYHWNGNDYAMSRKIADKDYVVLKKTSLAELSKSYSATIKQ